MAGKLNDDIEFVDGVLVERSPGSTIKVRLGTCTKCGALVREDYEEAHQKWHQQ